MENDEGVVDTRIITGLDDITVKNLWITGQNSNGVQTAFQPVQMDASDSRYLFENNVFTLSNFAIPAVTGANNSVIFKDNNFRNLLGKPADQQWQGRGLEITSSQDTVIIENNTFFNVNFTSFQMQNNTPNYLRFNQNTIVNNGRQIISGSQWLEAYFTNNLIINGWWHGEGFADLNQPGRETETSGLFAVGDLPTSIALPESRRIVMANMASWRDSEFNIFYGDSIQAQYYINDTTRTFFEDFENMIIQDTMWVSQPDLGTYPAELVDDMWAHINDLRTGQIPATPYFYQLPTDQNGNPAPLANSWPLPEDFSYTDDNLLEAGTNGLPLGDLNWFPDAKETWENRKQEEIDVIEGLAGEEVEITVIGEYQAEADNARLNGDASISSFDGFTWFDLQGGFIEWTFELDEPAVVGLDILQNIRSENIRGERIVLNGTNLRNTDALGEYTFCATNDPAVQSECANVSQVLPNNEFAEVQVRQENLIEGATALDLEAGTHTLRIEAVWGFQDFSSAEILDAATDEILVELPTAEATIGNNVFENCEDAVFCPAGFQTAKLGTQGNPASITWDIELEQAGMFAALLTYQAPDGSLDANIVGPTSSQSFQFTGAVNDSTGREIQTPQFELPAGSTSFTIETNGDKVYIDKMTLSRFGTLGGVPIEDDKLDRPDRFVLKQNFPNPFNPSTTIQFNLPNASRVNLTVYNILGREVATLVNQRMNAGSHSVQFDASRLASGMYIYRLEASDFVQNRKMMLIK